MFDRTVVDGAKCEDCQFVTQVDKTWVIGLNDEYAFIMKIRRADSEL